MIIDLLQRQWLAWPGCLLVLGALAGAATLAAWRLWAEARRTRAALAGAISGVIEDDGAGVVAEQSVEQIYEARDGWVRWREDVRRAGAPRAFVLVSDAGVRVAVPAGARLWWPLPTTEAISVARRRRCARVQPGMRVVVGGGRVAPAVAGGPFRDAMTALARGEVTLAEPGLAAQLLRQAAWLRLLAGWLALGSAALVLVLLAQLLGGERVMGQVTRVVLSGDEEATLVVEADGDARPFEVWRSAFAEQDDYDLAVTTKGTRAWLRRGPWPTRLRLGARAALPLGWLLVAGVALLVVGGVAFAAETRVRRLRWWTRSFDESAAPQSDRARAESFG